jgi:hypothetical protein
MQISEMEEIKKTVNINFKLNAFKWALSQPFQYPILVGFGIVLIASFLKESLLIGFLLCATIYGIVVLFGWEDKGIFFYSIVKSWFNYQFSKKVLLRKDLFSRNEATYDNCTITKDYAYVVASVNSEEYADETNKQSYNVSLTNLVSTATKPNFVYSIKTSLSKLKKSSLETYLNDTKKDLPLKLNGAYLALSDDLYSLYNQDEFNEVSTEFKISSQTVGAENLKKQVKNLNNEMRLFERTANGSKFIFNQEKTQK